MGYNIVAHGQYLVDQDKYAAAVLVLEEAIALYPQNLEVWILLSNAQSGLHHFRKADQAADEALRLKSGNLEAQCAKARALNGLKQYAQALSIIEAINRKFPTFALAHHIRVKILEETGQAAQAIQSYDRAVELDPTLALALAAKVGILVDSGRNQEALLVAQQAIMVKPTSIFAQCTLSMVYTYLGDTWRARSQAKSIIEHSHGEFLGWVTLGDTADFAGQNDLFSWTVAIKLNPEAPEFQGLLPGKWIEYSKKYGKNFIIFPFQSLFQFIRYIVASRVASSEKSQMRIEIAEQKAHFTTP